MHEYLIRMLVCPDCYGALNWSISERQLDRIETAAIHCLKCDAAYEVREGVGVFLTRNLMREDQWQQVESGLARYFRENPEVEHQLMNVTFEKLAPADQFFR